MQLIINAVIIPTYVSEWMLNCRETVKSKQNVTVPLQ